MTEPAPSTSPPDLPAAALAQAVMWTVRLMSGSASAADRQRCTEWRAAAPAHEAAWQQVQEVERAFGAVPDHTAAVAHRTLELTADARQRGGRRNTLKRLALTPTAVGGGALAMRKRPWQTPTSYASGIGERRRLVLDDGSQLLVNTDTRITVWLSPWRRQIRLERGEMLITTGADRQAWGGRRPFWVDTEDGAMQALGTEFTVYRVPQGTRLHVTEGKVAVYAVDGGATCARKRPSPPMRSADRPARSPHTPSSCQAGSRPRRPNHASSGAP